jgi:hypothetical protein
MPQAQSESVEWRGRRQEAPTGAVSWASGFLLSRAEESWHAPRVGSTLSRLFLYAKATRAEACENFTTEAIAGAIRVSPDLFLAVLADAGLVASTARLVSAFTQVPLVRSGTVRYLDLVIEVQEATVRRQLWLEVKVGAGESGDQLAAYREHIARWPTSPPPTLGVLGPRPLGGLPWISWQSLWRALASRESDPVWADIRAYLEEIKMADTYDEPITASELSSLRAAHGLTGKVARILTRFGVDARIIWPDSRWPASEAKVLDSVGRHFVRHGSLAIGATTRFRVGCSAGVYQEPTGETYVGLWLWAKPSWLPERTAVLQKTAGLEGWEAEGPEKWEFVGAYAPLSSFSAEGAATEWLTQRLRELGTAGVLALLPNLGQVQEGEDAEVDERE